MWAFEIPTKVLVEEVFLTAEKTPSNCILKYQKQTKQKIIEIKYTYLKMKTVKL